MARFRGSSINDSGISRSPGQERTHNYRSKLPPNAPEVVIQNTIDVSDPSKVLPRYRDDRRRNFNGLVRRYKAHLLYGCDDPGCQTSTCASHRRRVSEGPYRRYTELSARTLACYLASLDNAETGLCQNVPKGAPHLTAEDYHRISLRRTRTLEAQTAAAKRASQSNQNGEGASGHADNSVQTETNTSKVKERSSLPTVPAGTSYIRDLDEAAEQQLKDPKSFTQNLFDTISLRMVEWLPLRRAPDGSAPQPKLLPVEVGQESTAENLQLQDEDLPRKHHRVPKPPTHESQLRSQPHTPSSRTSGSQPSAVELNSQNKHVKRLSISDADHWRQSPPSFLDDKRKPEFNKRLPPTEELASLASPPALKHRPQKHRSNTALGLNPKERRRKSQRRVSWDSQKLLEETSPVKGSTSTGPVPSTPSFNAPPTSQLNTDGDLVEDAPDTVSLAQTVTHLTPEIIDGLSQVMIESSDSAENWKEELDRIQSTGSFEQPDWSVATLRQREAFPFVAQSAFYVFSSPSQILRSFSRESTDKIGASFSRLDVSRLRESLHRLFAICPWDIALHSMWSSLDRLFVPPQGFTSTGRPSRRSSRSSTMTSHVSPSIIPQRTSESVNDHHLSDSEAAYIATVALFTLISFVPNIDSDTWRAVVQMRAAGSVASLSDMSKLSPQNAQQAMEVTDSFEHELGLRLINRLVQALTARLAYHEISKACHVYSPDLPKQSSVNVLDRVMDYLSEHHVSHDSRDESPESINTASLIVEWLRTLFLREWNGNPELARSSPAAGAIQILASMYKGRSRLGISPEDFHTPILSVRLDPMDMPVAWAGALPNNRTIHLLSYPFLFPPSALVAYFRALNHSAMAKYFDAASTTARHVNQTAIGHIPIFDGPRLLSRMRTSMTTYLVIVVRREHILSDALNQLWRREKRELMRPLKVQMGMEEGEEGIDHGGVQQEFFRILMGQALDPSYGMFTFDQRHRLSWFQPCSLEPLYKFELIGLLMSIAIYNGVTLPVSFPIAFYRKLLGLKVKHLKHIQDGWPELSQGLDSLLTWTDGDVGDVFMRTYEFSFEAFGSIETVDMQKVGRNTAWPPVDKVATPAPLAGSSAWMDVPNHGDAVTGSKTEITDTVTSGSTLDKTGEFNVASPRSLPSPIKKATTNHQPSPSEEAALVTNQNRDQFVKDYIFWLTDKSIRPQFEAFQRGFNTCLDRSALSIFSPEALKTVVEGIQSIDMKELEVHAQYEGGYSPRHRLIQDFWSIVQEYPNEKKARLLKFVTSSDRVPVNGVSSIMFFIQKNGVGDLRLPTSLTCFGRLLLPEYSSKEVLSEKLDKALENDEGFGFG
ncbi:hypothetical protein N7535_001502 [Penicillium sp. DV-2018c]|nr:hypothetical protein N7461_005253 [Penicillium sp. DV-2018c]KAJ5582882.1 hypothetical protein N7535_001502 [Penicillium sp. DV-2018c]